MRPIFLFIAILLPLFLSAQSTREQQAVQIEAVVQNSL